MKNVTDPQTKKEIGRQGAFGEQQKRRADELEEQVTGNVGLRVGTDEEHGFSRDDANQIDTPVKTSDDERHPNIPDHAHSDHGPKPADV